MNERAVQDWLLVAEPLIRFAEENPEEESEVIHSTVATIRQHLDALFDVISTDENECNEFLEVATADFMNNHRLAREFLQTKKVQEKDFNFWTLEQLQVIAEELKQKPQMVFTGKFLSAWQGLLEKRFPESARALLEPIFYFASAYGKLKCDIESTPEE